MIMIASPVADVVGERRGIDGGPSLPGPELVERPLRRAFASTRAASRAARTARSCNTRVSRSTAGRLLPPRPSAAETRRTAFPAERRRSRNTVRAARPTAFNFLTARVRRLTAWAHNPESPRDDGPEPDYEERGT